MVRFTHPTKLQNYGPNMVRFTHPTEIIIFPETVCLRLLSDKIISGEVSVHRQIEFLLISVVAIVTAVFAGQSSLAQTYPNAGQPRQYQPSQPQYSAPPSRLDSWAGGQAESTPWGSPEQRQNQSAPQSPKNDNLKPCPGTRIIARVGAIAVLESEVNGAVNELIEKNKDRIPKEQIEAQRELLIQQRLKSLIEAKLIYEDARRTIPAEGWQKIHEQLINAFEESQLEKLIENAGVANRHELDLKLRSLGTSLEQERRSFCERSLAQQWIHQQVKVDEEVTCDRIIGYYQSHTEEFTHPARAKWSELMVRFSDYPNKAAARDALAQMGNQVLGGTPFAEVAKRGSTGLTASEGGAQDWTVKGSLVSDEFDRALFGLPIGQLSPIIETAIGFHIIRVTEREPVRVTPFREAQVEIRKNIVQEERKKQFETYMAKLQTQTPVWTIFDEKEDQTMISGRPEQRR